MSVVKINAITPIEGREGDLEARFGARGHDVDTMEGFEGFALLRPVKGESRYFVFTQWRSEEDFQRWVNSDAFRRRHGQANRGDPVATGATLLAFEVVEWPDSEEESKAA